MSMNDIRVTEVQCQILALQKTNAGAVLALTKYLPSQMGEQYKKFSRRDTM